ncbi:oligoribonuclease [Eikenella sp. S3360]|uniref:Oligoribonuclease n=1 Tax=Eikenella glucosivorans TaxID=2766967 RepID=A0ABS0NCC9_9NEIS|nr:oligoribonuclease [Eikenella glucosivorans]MBH5329943.1 oligoribonuclease [Eikenella glucosivorans]
MAKQPNPTNLCWLDMEMTGLNPEHDRIIEAAAVITDADLNILAQSESYAIHQSDELLNGMDAWNTATHARTGLTQRVKASTLSEAEVEQRLLDFIAPWIPQGTSPLCGNTIHQDRRFMLRYMPRLEAWFHYRNLDVSTLKELARRWHPAAYRGFSKKGAHQALDDILESIEELRHYRQTFLRLPEAKETNQEAT